MYRLVLPPPSTSPLHAFVTSGAGWKQAEVRGCEERDGVARYAMGEGIFISFSSCGVSLASHFFGEDEMRCSESDRHPGLGVGRKMPLGGWLAGEPE